MKRNKVKELVESRTQELFDKMGESKFIIENMRIGKAKEKEINKERENLINIQKNYNINKSVLITL